MKMEVFMKEKCIMDLGMALDNLFLKILNMMDVGRVIVIVDKEPCMRMDNCVMKEHLSMVCTKDMGNRGIIRLNILKETSITRISIF